MPVDLQPELFEELPVQTVSSSGLFAEVVFNRPLDHAYSYAVPEELRGELTVGKRVLAPFGRGDKVATGFCVGLTDQVPKRAVKEIVKVLDEESLLTPHLLRLTRWLADYYVCGWGQVLNGIIPAGARQQAGTRVTIFLEPLAEYPDPLPRLSDKQAHALEKLRAYGKPIEPQRLAKLADCGLSPVHLLVEKGLARRIESRVERFAPVVEEPSTVSTSPITLNADQVQVWSDLEPALREGVFKPFLLFGVTGSGKTELYLRAIEEVVRQGKEALVLVPEISLTPQTIDIFRSRYTAVSVLHSHLHQTERGGHWRQIRAGQAQVVVGARSAIFAPTRRLGLIVVDEEHESSFKQEQTPRYHARDVALMRARLENIPIILGSATPALESWHNAHQGKYELVTLPKRVLDLPLPKVGLIDLRYDRAPGPRLQALSPSLERGMQNALAAGGQVILLLNRRGHSTFVHCPGCGFVEQCEFCDLSLTYHKERDVTLCHHCGFEKAPPVRCPNCGAGQVRYQGIGTEKLQAEVEAKFARYTVRRMDSDTTKQHGSHKKILDAFRQAKIDILLGTQMIAKGLDFPNVTLVGVVNADVGLHRADFRAAEKTFQLLAQVSGRAGRGAQGGRVLIQTMSPEHPSIAMAAQHDYEGFARAEMEHRKAHSYPPYQRLARLVVRSKNQEAACGFADKLAGAFRVALSKSVDGQLRLLGPAEAPVFRLKGYFRYHFQLQSPDSGYMHDVLRRVIPAVKLPAGVELTVDIDPLDML